MAHAVVNQHGGVQVLHTFVYDKVGNPLQEHIYGNLTGNNQANPMLGSDLKPVKNACESHGKISTFSGFPFNHKLSETIDNKKTLFSYFPDSDQLQSKLVYEDAQLKERAFYKYNAHGMLIEEITDNGDSDVEDSLSGVTYRHIRSIEFPKEKPTYLPTEERQAYLDENGAKQQIQRLVNHYDNYGHLIVQDHHDANDNLRYRLHWGYDKQGNCIYEVNAAGEPTHRKYDANKNLIYEQGPNSNYHMEMTYDYMNRLTSQAKVDNHTKVHYKTTNKYDHRNRLTATIDMYGNQTSYEYDFFDRLIKTIAPPIPDQYDNLFKAEEHFAYDTLGHQTHHVNGNGNTTEQKNTIRGKPYHIAYPDGSEEKITYYENGNVQRKVDKNGMVTHYDYDYKDRPTITHMSSDEIHLSRHEIIYDAFNPIEEIDALGNRTIHQYNRQGQLIATIKGEEETHYTYDALGRKNSAKTFFGHNPSDYSIQKWEYDLKNQIIEDKTEDAEGNLLRKETYAYDTDGNKTHIDTYAAASIGTTIITYDIHQKPIKIVDPEGNVTHIHYRYDYIDRFKVCVPYSESTDPKGNITITIGNAIGKTAMIQRKNSLGQLLQQKEFVYDGAQQLVLTREKVIPSQIPNQEIVTQWKYNAVGEVLECIEAVGTPEERTTKNFYNTFSQKIETIKPDGSCLFYTYDGKGRLATVSSSDKTLSYAYQYDNHDNPTKISDLIYHTDNIREYDHDRLVKETLGNQLTLAYAYDRQGRLQTITLPDQSCIKYVYNGTDLIEVQRQTAEGKTAYSQSYQHDTVGNLLTQTLPFNQGSIQYTYDLLNRHLSTETTHFNETNVSYDPIGNLIAHTLTDSIGELSCRYDYDPLYQLTEETGLASHIYQYDSVHNRLKKDEQDFSFNALNQLLGNGYTYDSNGNLIARHDQKYTYDAWDRLLTVTEGNQRYAYQYDDSHRRLSKIHSQWDPLQNAWIPQKTCYFLYENNNEIGICDEEKRFHELRILGEGRGAEIGAAIAYEIDNEVYIPLHQATGSPRMLLNSSGNPVEIYRYTAFGEEVVLDPKGDQKKPITSWRFCSKRTDPETGLIYFGRRYYDPTTARWITTDPLGYDEGPNLYAYVNNNPLTHLDLYGLYDWMEFEQQQIFDERFDSQIRNECCMDFWHAAYNRESYWFWDMPQEVQNGSCYHNALCGKVSEYGYSLGKTYALYRIGRALPASIASFVPIIQNARTFQGLYKFFSRNQRPQETPTRLLEFQETPIQKIDNEISINHISSVNQKPDFVVGPNGLTIATNRNVLETGFREAGFQSFKPESPGIGYILPNNMKVRIMEPAGKAPLRASFTNSNGGPICPFIRKPPQPPRGMPSKERLKFIREKTHQELYP